MPRIWAGADMPVSSIKTKPWLRPLADPLAETAARLAAEARSDVIDPEIDAFVASFCHMFARALRAVLIGVAAYSLLNIQTHRSTDFLLISGVLAALSLTNLTKWVSVIGIGLLVVLALAP